MAQRLTKIISRNDRGLRFSFSVARELYSRKKTQSLGACLPHEILQEIFQYCLAPSRATTWQPNNTATLLILCHICSSWRISAFGDHRLWRNLDIVLKLAHRSWPFSDIGVPQAQVDMINWWTTRITSGNYTYSFQFMLCSIAPSGKAGKKYVNHLEVFSLPAVVSARSVTLLMLMIPETFTQLGGWRTPFVQPRPLPLSWKNHPIISELKPLHISLLYRLKTSNPRLTSPWGQLTHLIVLHDFRPFSWQDLLEPCTKLECAALYINPEHSRTSKSIVHANLRLLVAQSCHFVPNNLLEGILLPSLHTLCLSVIDFSFLDDWSSYVVYSRPISLGSLHTILRSTPSLKKLRLHNCIGSFDQPSSSLPVQTIDPLSMFAPYLEHLVIEKLQDTWDVPQNIVEFAQSRWICANWGTDFSSPLSSSAGSGRTPRQLHVEVILSKFACSKSVLDHARIAVGDFYHPHVQLTLTELEGKYRDPSSIIGHQPGASDMWEELSEFRAPV